MLCRFLQYLPLQQPQRGRLGKAGAAGKAPGWAAASDGHAAGGGVPGGQHVKISGGFADFSVGWKCSWFILLWEVQQYNQK